MVPYGRQIVIGKITVQYLLAILYDTDIIVNVAQVSSKWPFFKRHIVIISHHCRRLRRNPSLMPQKPFQTHPRPPEFRAPAPVLPPTPFRAF